MQSVMCGLIISKIIMVIIISSENEQKITGKEVTEASLEHRVNGLQEDIWASSGCAWLEGK